MNGFACRMRLGALLFIVVLAMTHPAERARAGDIPASSEQVSITARGTALDDFLQRLFAEAGFRVQVSNSLRGRPVNGRFNGSVDEVWNRISTALSLIGYWDGTIIRVYAASDITNRRFENVDSVAIEREAKRLKLPDANNTLSPGGTTLTATGVPAFLQQISAIAGRNRAPFGEAAGSDASEPARIVQPPAVRGDASAIVQSELLRQATVRDPYEVRIFFLRYASANDTFVRAGDFENRVPGIASILSGIMGDGRIPQTVSTSGETFDGLGPVLRPRIDLLDDDGIALIPSMRRQDEGGDAPDVVAPFGVNGPRIEVDETRNAVIVRDRPEAMPVFEGIIEALDQPPRMVEIEAVIIDLNIDRLQDLGLDIDIQVDGLDLLFGGTSFDPTPGFSSPNIEGSYVTGSGDTFAARITALERTGAVNVVSRPQLITLDNRAALFDSTQEIFVEIEGAVSRLERISIGTVLRVTPAIIDDDVTPRVGLRIEIEDGAPTESVVDGLPVLRRSRVISQALIGQGESLLLGGITIDSEFEFRSKTPILGDIPLFGQLFRRRREGSTRVERLFLLTPRIIGGDETISPSSTRDPIPLKTLQDLPVDKVDAGSRKRRRQGGRG
ncbi:MAG: type III secretion system outer membrane ring subunit SctC [Erythrobacter sp.]